MTIKIRTTPFERNSGSHPGTFEVHHDVVLSHLIEIAMAGSSELPGDFGDDPDPNDTDLSIIRFDPGPQDTTTAAGRVRQKLKDLIDRPGDIILFGFDSDYVYGDGTTLSGFSRRGDRRMDLLRY